MQTVINLLVSAGTDPGTYLLNIDVNSRVCCDKSPHLLRGLRKVRFGKVRIARGGLVSSIAEYLADQERALSGNHDPAGYVCLRASMRVSSSPAALRTRRHVLCRSVRCAPCAIRMMT